MTRAARETRMTELGLELQCSCCRDFWPADSQFFYRCATDKTGFHSLCRACCDARVYSNRIAAGVTKPRDAGLPITTWHPLLTWSHGRAEVRA